MRCVRVALILGAGLWATALPTFAQSKDRASFDLICPGIGERLEAHEHYGYDWDRNKHKYVRNDDIQYDRERQSGTAQVEIHDGQGRIKPPKKLLPVLASGGQDGWWSLQDLRIDDDSITATYRLNGMNRPTVSIDRRTGRIRLAGIETFEGNCTAFDPDQKRF